jgi:putative ABC transport system permease protein
MGARTPLAWHLLTHKKGRLLVSLAGVAFAAVLMFLEMGFLNGLYDSATQPVRYMNADLIMVGGQKEAVVPRRPFPRRRLIQVRAQAGVAAVYPVYAADFAATWKAPPYHHERIIMVYGFDPDDPVFLIPEVTEHVEELKKPGTALIDSNAKETFGDRLPGVVGELAHRTIRVVATFPLGPDFRNDGNMIVGEQTFLECFADRRAAGATASQLEFGLIKLSPGARPKVVRDALRAWLPGDVQVLTRDEFIDHIKEYWGTTQPVGYVFGLGTLVGFLIGVTICYQILFSDIMDHLPQYATLKAMGYSTAFLIRVVLTEAVYLGVLGFFPGLVVALASYAAIQVVSGIIMELTVGRAVFVLVLTVLMCAVSGLLALRRLIRSDPAEVF